MTDLVKRLRIKAGVIEMGEMIAWGSDSALMREAADALEMAAPAEQGEPVAYRVTGSYTDAPFKDESSAKAYCRGLLSGDPEGGYRITPLYAAAPAVQGEPVGEVRFEFGVPSLVYAELYSETLPSLAPGTKLYTAPQPAEQKPDVAQLVEALERAHMALIGYLPGHRNDITDAAISQCEQVLAAHRKQQEQSNDCHKALVGRLK